MESNKSEFTLRIERELLQKLHYVAEYNGCSANNEVNELIKKHVDEFEMKVEKVPSDWLKENRRVK